LIGFGLAMLLAFVWSEGRTDEPILPFSLFKNRMITVSTIGLIVMGVSMFGTILYIPLFIQAVIGTSATDSGTVMMPMMMAMIGSSVISGQLIARTGRYKLMSIAGLSVGTFGMFLLSGMGPDTDYLTVVRNMVLIGLGLGPVMPVFTLVSQAAVRMDQLGVATSLTQFARSIGGTLGTAIFGSVLVTRFQPALQQAMPPQLAAVPSEQMAAFENPLALLNPESATLMQAALAQFGPQAGEIYTGFVEAIKIALTSSLHDVFLLGAIVAALGVINALFMHEVPLRQAMPARATGSVPTPGAPARTEPDARSGLPGSESSIRHPRPAPGR
jgi:MFS family permease